MLAYLTGIIEMINAYSEQQDRIRALRRMILDECYVNLDLLALLQAKCVRDDQAEWSRICAALQSDSRQVLQLANIEAAALFRKNDRQRLLSLLTGGSREEKRIDDFHGWTAFELYHYVHNKIATLKVIAAGDHAVIAKLRPGTRADNIRKALVHLCASLREQWQLAAT